MNSHSSKELLTLSQLSLSPTDLNNQIFNIQTEYGPRPITLRKVNRHDSCLIADIRRGDNPSQIYTHMVINPFITRIFISQTILPSHQKPEKKS